MKISNSELKVVRFANEDVIATSMFFVADPNSDTGYYRIDNGAMVPSDEAGTWIVVYDPYSKMEVGSETLDYARENVNFLYNADSIFDAYVDPNGSGAYYTKGVSYWELYGNQ